MGERVAALETRFDGHEQRCDDRQVAMGREIRELKDGFAGLTKGAWGVAIALLAWAAVTLYGKIDTGPRPLPLSAEVGIPTAH